MRGLSLHQIRDLIRFAFQRLKEEKLPQVAGSLTFTTVLAVVPTITIALAIFTAFPLFNSFRNALEAYFIQSLMPKGIANTILGYLTQFAAKATRLSAVGAIALIFTAISTMAMIDKTFNQIWHIDRARPFVQRVLVYWTIITLGPLLIGASITVTSYLFTATSGVVGSVPLLGATLYTLISIIFTNIAFTALYVSVPNRVIAWKDAFWGGLFSAIAFEIAKRVFAIFVTHFSTYTLVYGALAAVPIFLIWVYFSWLITLFGAVITAALPVIKYERWWHVSVPGSTFLDAIEILKILCRARLHQQNLAVSTAHIRKITRLGLDEIESLLENMLIAGWVSKVEAQRALRQAWWKKSDEGIELWVLATNPDHLRYADVFRQFAYNTRDNSGLSKSIHAMIDQHLHMSLAQQCLLQPEETNIVAEN
jgi:membrane protein